MTFVLTIDIPIIYQLVKIGSSIRVPNVTVKNGSYLRLGIDCVIEFGNAKTVPIIILGNHWHAN